MQTKKRNEKRTDSKKPDKKSKKSYTSSTKSLRGPVYLKSRSTTMSTGETMKSTSENFINAGKEVASLGKEILKQVYVAPGETMTKVVAMAVRAEKDAVFGRKVQMILGMILTTLMFLMARLNSSYDVTKGMNTNLPIPSLNGSNFDVKFHSIWSVSATAIGMAIAGRALLMTKKEQFSYFVDFIIMFLICFVLYFIIVYIIKPQGQGLSMPFITSDKVFTETDNALIASKDVIMRIVGTIKKFFSANMIGPFGRLFAYDESKGSVAGSNEVKISTSEILKGNTTTSQGGKKSKRRRRKVQGGTKSLDQYGISLPAVLAILTGLFAVGGYLYEPSRRDKFFRKLEEQLAYLSSRFKKKSKEIEPDSSIDKEDTFFSMGENSLFSEGFEM